jgi:chemotaxis protein methyltransferase WspC
MALEDQGVAATAYRIDAVDLSPDHLSRAAAAVYSGFAFREAGADPRPRCFLPTTDGRWELMARFREPVRFRCGNAIAPDFLSGELPYDLILCRNLFIYLTPEARKLAIANLDRLLAPDGRLCLTPAEADRLADTRFIPDGPPALATFRRGTGAKSGPGSGTIPAPTSGRIPQPDGRSQPPSGRTPVPETRTEPPSGRIPVPDLPATSSPKSGRIPVVEPLPPAPPPPTTADARSLANAGRLDEARKVCEQLIRTGPPSPDLFALLGVVHLAAGRWPDAADALRKALYLDPDHHEALTHMVVVHEHRGEREPASALRRRLARLGRRDLT